MSTPTSTDSPESAAERHLSAAVKAAAQVADIPASVTPRPIKRVAVIGAGTMGSGIAMRSPTEACRSR